MEEKIGL